MNFIQLAFILINLLIAVYDFAFYRIPNIFLAALLVLFLVMGIFHYNYYQIALHFGVSIIVLIIGYVLFLTKLIGAGDAKYLAVASLWAGDSSFFPFIFITAIIGGIISIIYLSFPNSVQVASARVWAFLLKQEERNPWMRLAWKGSGSGFEMGKREAVNPREIPYGLAIAGSAILLALSW